MIFFGVVPYARAVKCVIAGLIFEEFIHVIFLVLGLCSGESVKSKLSETIMPAGKRDRKEEG
jgi:hypothetical protein